MCVCGVVCVCGKTNYTATLKVFRVKVLSVAIILIMIIQNFTMIILIWFNMSYQDNEKSKSHLT